MIILPGDLPSPDQQRQRVEYRLPITLIKVVNTFRQEYRDLYPEICILPSRFVETALRFFMRHLEQENS